MQPAHNADLFSVKILPGSQDGKIKQTVIPWCPSCFGKYAVTSFSVTRAYSNARL